MYNRDFFLHCYHQPIVYVTLNSKTTIKMAPTKKGGKTKHMKNGGKDGSEPKVKNLSETPVRTGADPALWIGVVTKIYGGDRYSVQEVDDKGVKIETHNVKKMAGLRGRIEINTLLRCERLMYVSSEKKPSIVNYIYDRREIDYLKQIGEIHGQYEAFVDPNLKEKILAEGAAAAAGADTGFDFGEEIDLEKV